MDDGDAVITGGGLAGRLAAALAARADPERATGMERYMRDQFPFLGVPSLGQKAAWREATTDVPRLVPEPVVVDAARDLWARPEREHQYLACTLVNRHAGTHPRSPRATAGFLDTVEELLTTRPWWDTVDALAIRAVGDLVRHHPELRARMDAWLVGDDMWLIRSALLHMNRWRDATDADWLFAACRARGGHPDFFVRKAIGWALREYSKTDAAAVVAFVAANEDTLSGLSRREALVWLERRRRRRTTEKG
jgi:3-methyladenine DNA glycosylase AlkD